MPTLIVAGTVAPVFVGGTPPLSAVYDQRISAAALRAGWSVLHASRGNVPVDVPEPVVYVTTELAVQAAQALDVALLEPSFDLLARVPTPFLRRAVEFATFADLSRLQRRTFVKPANPLDKWFDAGLYANARDIRTCGRACPDAPVLLSEPVEWSVELRYFVLEGCVVAGSPYLSYGRPQIYA